MGIRDSYNPTLFAPNVFPDPQFQTALSEYSDAVRGFSDDMFRLFALSLNLKEDHFAEMVNEGMDSLNCLHYPPLEGKATQMGIGSHTDLSLIHISEPTRPY
eukprot:TRINITY_DN29398_c0_g1_i1.p1 TRINITY_DN29398_c0_g1~~TRINITY_DN29398_c0_g1_i1.p1  ORF type:complete len:102 (+),score=15.76 TRINITY_DN29398_c0_g1_i1:98-403(+)